ncbi:hypothetical protein [Rhodopirellula europaea]|uniref:hypothetical protein n=1 Tax=Rhodopirellula europaea TaxID=1263866 RepID=UPI00055CBC25|nr:hypothetical protein [Rhodopirellula europaea]
MAEHFSYGDSKTASVRDAQFRGQYCRISVYGPKGGSHVKGNYDETNGVLKIDVDRMSYLEVSGRAKKVVIAFVDRGSNVNLANLSIGAGGVEIHSVRRSKVDIGQCEGPATIKNVESSSITLHPGTTVIGRDRLTDGSKVFFEE